MERLSARKILTVIRLEERQKEYLKKAAPDAAFCFTSVKEVTLQQVGEAEIIIGNIPPALLKHAKNLKWLQLNSAGADPYLKEGVLPEGVILTNAAGAYGLAVSEHMLACLLALKKKLPIYRLNQMNHQWKDEGQVGTIYNTTTLILGMGDIGSEFAKKMKALGSYIIGVRRNPSARPEFADEICTTDALDDVLERADTVALFLPGTAGTNGMFHKERFSKMKKGAVILNGGRGNVIDTMELYRALESGHLGGAALDVTDPEPLPEDHPLWDCGQCILTPHTAGGFRLPETRERISQIAAKNIETYLKGERLKNQVDFEAGY